MAMYDLTLNGEAATEPFDLMYSRVEHAAQDMASSAAVAYWAKETGDISYHAKKVIEALKRTADHLGFIAIPKADHWAMTDFIAELRDHKPTIISGRHKSGDPAWDEDDAMPLAEFEAFQADAEALIPKPPKAKVA